MSERLGMEWWEMSPTPEPGERVEGEEGEGREEMMMEGRLLLGLRYATADTNPDRSTSQMSRCS